MDKILKNPIVIGVIITVAGLALYEYVIKPQLNKAMPASVAGTNTETESFEGTQYIKTR